VAIYERNKVNGIGPTASLLSVIALSSHWSLSLRATVVWASYQGAADFNRRGDLL
jgi:hypothetical protein